MKKMIIPGFNAVASLYDIKDRYDVNGESKGLLSISTIRPQMRSSGGRPSMNNTGCTVCDVMIICPLDGKDMSTCRYETYNCKPIAC